MKLPDDLAEAEAEASLSPRPISVSNYHFVDDDDEPVSFSVLPIRWSDTDEGTATDKAVNVFLLGNAGGGGARRVHKHVVAWRFDLSHATEPEISVFSSDNTWVELREPKKRYEDVVRPVLVTLQCLHFATRNPEKAEKPLGRHIAKVFGLHEARPFESDLADHLSLISEAIERNESLAKSKFLLAFLDRSPEIREPHKDLDTSKFICDEMDYEFVDDSEEDEFSEDHDPYDAVCALCDEGGDLICCEGRCLRSFHATKKAASTAKPPCKSLGFTQKEVDEMSNFVCENCKYEQHQCYICGKLGSSCESEGPEVFSCCSATCGRFYHAHCVSKLLHWDTGAPMKEIEKDVARGQPFTCPIHKCSFCKEDEDEDGNDPELQFAVCRRCPKSYHIKCLPKIIAFKDDKKTGVVKRAWRDLLPNRVLMYCLHHEIDKNTGAAFRNHIIFPGVEPKPSSSRKSKTRDTNPRCETNWKSPSDKRDHKRRGISGPASLVFNGASATSRLPKIMHFAPGPWEAYEHHVNGGWLD